MNYDLRTPNSAYGFVLNFLQMSSREFTLEYNVESNSNFEIFWNKYFKKINTINIKELKIIAFHVLGSLNDCEDIKQYGLWNLQMVLSGNTNLSLHLKKYGITFNIAKMQMYYKDQYYNINYDRSHGRYELSELEYKIELIAHRIYYDFCVNGFLFNDDVLSYGTNIHKRPEIILKLVTMFPELSQMDKEWSEHSTSYRIDFFADFCQAHRFSFELDNYDDPPFTDWVNLNDEQKFKKWMLFNAINRAYNNLCNKVLYIKNDVIIPPNQIISYTKI